MILNKFLIIILDPQRKFDKHVKNLNSKDQP